MGIHRKPGNRRSARGQHLGTTSAQIIAFNKGIAQKIAEEV